MQEEKVSIPYHLRADPGEKNKVAIYRVQDGKKLKLKQVTIAFPSGTLGELRIGRSPYRTW